MTGHSGNLTINLTALRHNYRLMDQMIAPSCITAPAVKADAYGVGVQHAAPAFYDEGARHFFVATIEEAVTLRTILPDAHIYVLNGFWMPAKQEYLACKLTPVLNSLEELELYKLFARECAQVLPAFLHFNTGMNRLGFPAHDVAELAADPLLLEAINVSGVMSHFMYSDNPESDDNMRQYEQFQKITRGYDHAMKSLCNSGGVVLSREYHMDMTRPGIALYGGQPVNGRAIDLRPVVSLEAPVLQVHSVQENETAGYNSTYRFNEKGCVALVSIGYADGFLRYLGNEGSLYYKGAALPIRGRVSMDVVICDLSELPEENHPKIGDSVEVIGPHQTIDDLASAAGTISYEILTSLGPRYSRSYIK